MIGGRRKAMKTSKCCLLTFYHRTVQQGSGLIKVNGVPLSLYGSPILRPKLYVRPHRACLVLPSSH